MVLAFPHHDPMHVSAHHDTADAHHSSFILRCYYQQRGPVEGPKCQQLRHLWRNKTMVKTLPDGKDFQQKCGNPKFFMVGGKFYDRFGTWPAQAPESVDFPNEEWYKCCLDSPKERLECQHVNLVKRNDVVNLRDGYCGSHDGEQVPCTGHRDRCLEAEHSSTYTPQKKGTLKLPKPEKTNPKGEDVGTAKCPGDCAKGCVKTSKKPECIYVGPEPVLGEEGDSTPSYAETGDREDYDVIALSIPAAMLVFPCAMLHRLDAKENAAFL
eukprot:GEMP01046963.1.p1 GENE.GEMP01046963.1~~GEMP01046963.1.p1  ORF type:complete len:268 (+),score=67.04 GEMP01046963.1:192-995(+)